MLTLTLLISTSSALATDEACADRAALTEPATTGSLTEAQQRCLQGAVDRNTPESWEAAALLWRHLRGAGVEDERRFKALRAAIDRSAPRGDVLLFAEGFAGAEARLDGLDVGRVPARIRNVAAGPHAVEILAADGSVVSMVAEVVHDPQGVTLVHAR